MADSKADLVRTVGLVVAVVFGGFILVAASGTREAGQLSMVTYGIGALFLLQGLQFLTDLL